MAYNTNQDRLASKTVQNLEQSLGKNGLVFINNENSTTTNGVAIQCLTDCSFSNLVIGNVNLTPNNFTLSLTAGTIIYGHVTSVTISEVNQKAIVYNK